MAKYETMDLELRNSPLAQVTAWLIAVLLRSAALLLHDGSLVATTPLHSCSCHPSPSAQQHESRAWLFLAIVCTPQNSPSLRCRPSAAGSRGMCTSRRWWRAGSLCWLPASPSASWPSSSTGFGTLIFCWWLCKLLGAGHSQRQQTLVNHHAHLTQTLLRRPSEGCGLRCITPRSVSSAITLVRHNLDLWRQTCSCYTARQLVIRPCAQQCTVAAALWHRQLRAGIRYLHGLHAGVCGAGDAARDQRRAGRPGRRRRHLRAEGLSCLDLGLQSAAAPTACRILAKPCCRSLPSGWCIPISMPSTQAHFNGVYTKGMLGFRPAVAQSISGVFVNAANIIGVGGLQFLMYNCPQPTVPASICTHMDRVAQGKG